MKSHSHYIYYVRADTVLSDYKAEVFILAREALFPDFDPAEPLLIIKLYQAFQLC